MLSAPSLKGVCSRTDDLFSSNNVCVGMKTKLVDSITLVVPTGMVVAVVVAELIEFVIKSFVALDSCRMLLELGEESVKNSNYVYRP